jgi:hypothetical protein
MRRQIAQGFTVLDKAAWTPQLDYRSSLALRSERIVIDSSCRMRCASSRSIGRDRSHARI